MICHCAASLFSSCACVTDYRKTDALGIVAVLSQSTAAAPTGREMLWQGKQGKIEQCLQGKHAVRLKIRRAKLLMKQTGHRQG
jgi:ribosomal protein L21